MLAVVLLAAAPINSEAHHFDKGITPCKQKYVGVERVKCYIKRASAHFNQSYSYALSVASCESGLRPKANENPPYLGIYQFDKTTWRSAPWRHRSRYNARASALNAMWYWAKGEYSRWPVCG